MIARKIPSMLGAIDLLNKKGASALMDVERE